MKRTAVLLTIGAACTLLAPPAFAGPVDGKKVDKSRDEVLSYWTPERMKSATPKERAAKPNGKPGGPVGGGSATWGAEPLVNGSYAGSDVQNGKVYMTERGVNYVCSGTSVATGGSDAVWTAGHCVNEGPGQFVTNWMFVPAYYNGTRPFGRFVATTLYTTSAWKSSGNFDYDLGAARVALSDTGYDLSTTVGGRGVEFTYDPSALTVRSFGYPAAGKFNGQSQQFCQAPVSLRDGSYALAPMGISCNMTGGSSGGGWIDAGSGKIASVNSYGYSSLKNVMFGPVQGTTASALYACAQGTGTSCTATP